MREYFFLALLGITLGLLGVACCIGCNARRQQRLQSLQREGIDARYNAYGEGVTNNAGGTSNALGQRPRWSTDLSQEIYYQQPYLQGGGYYGGNLRPGAANVNHNGGRPPGPSQEVISGTVLFAAPAGAQADNANYTVHFPEAHVLGVNDPGHYTCDNAAAGNTVSHSTVESPYGEADYVSRPSDVALQKRSQRSSPRSVSTASSKPPGLAFPLPQHQTKP
ncbi:hypothetical_protein [Leishmania braziliensis MHOM/BR/75/M2904]|uniref:Hypothetical_protein n=1 Tax=Leishmania braziliensis MHOM/BR/75/M2904 TaxID=420245 RepID=A0A3P3ZDX1_LEIBR|nr:unnamed protein product [Leishmania braziliensis]SYZ68377.1 hypothetical_protein [Leishmania braziliensis MHOM/BR/75/M2904]